MARHRIPEYDPRLVEKEKPLRLLVEIVANKDEKHGTKSQEFGRVMLMVDQAPSRINPRDMECRPAMSVQKLDIPSLTYLGGVLANALYMHGTLNYTAGAREILAACGLEVSE